MQFVPAASGGSGRWRSISRIQPNGLPNGQHSFGMTVSNGVLGNVSSF